jgi:glycosyltransferase involved in cell wall biosynthesis
MVTIGIWFYADPVGLERTLDGLRKHTDRPYKLVVLGDGLPAQRSDLPGRAYLNSETPLGAAVCFNRLITHDDAQVVVFLESGSMVTPNWLDRLVEALQTDPDHGLAGPSTNRAWNTQRLHDAPQDKAPAHVVEAYAAQVARHSQGAYRTLEPLYSLADFCYAVKRQVIDAVGEADANYGRGPCWEMDYNIRAARAGFKGVWACAAYVHRPPLATTRQRHEALLSAANRRHYQDKFCQLKLEQRRSSYCGHCTGDACAHFAPGELIQMRLPARAIDGNIPHRTEWTSRQQQAPVLYSTPLPRTQRQITFSLPHIAEHSPLVSCIMPTYNRRPFVAQAIHYFLQQDYLQRQLIIVDDGTEPVQDLIPDDPRLRYVRLDRKHTIGTKRNLACQEAQGDIIIHWDDDDWMAPWRLRYQVDHLQTAQADICGLDRVLFYDPRLERAWNYVYPTGANPWVAGGTLCYTRAFWQQHPFPDLNVGEDTRFVWSTPATRLLALPDQTFYVALVHPGNTSPKRTSDQRWRPYPAGEMRALLGADWKFYQGSMNGTPLVSCIMPTYNRRRFVSQAIQYFGRQDYPHRELIVVDDGPDAVGDLMPNVSNIRYIRLPQKRSIGAKRNLACEAARGEIIICWDDDDWYAPNRIAYQVSALLGGKADATGLDRGLLISLPGRQFWTSSAQLHSRMFAQGIVGGTLAFWKCLWNQRVRFPDASLAEDAVFLQALVRRGARIARLENAGTFIYVRHDQNSWRFTPGHFLDGSGWQRVEPPAFMSEPDLEFYGVHTRAKGSSSA